MPSEAIEQLSSWIDSLPNWGKAAVAGGAALTIYIPYRFWVGQPRASPYVKDFKKDVVYLFQFPRTSVSPNSSPYCLKVETWLRMSDITYEIPKISWNVRSKEGTLPFVEYNGVEYFDSNFIIRDLDKTIDQHVSIDDHLTSEQKATTRAFEAMIEKSLSISAWVNRLENADKIMDTLNPKEFGFLGALFKMLSINSYASLLSRRIAGTDLGFHKREDRIQIGIDDLKAISNYLGNKHFLHGFKPTKVDACLFANLVQILFAPYESEHREVIRSEMKNLEDYVERIRSRFWPDWSDATKNFSTNSNWRKRPTPTKNGSSLNGKLAK
ncbi:unnamed protein product [Caenorhabditis angaria]|uniref:Failed axon connections-like protein n=1 Tax=Caenorhabditis angaria TaxID=860376 RepID=A0A9P1MVX6_9PELO|nr:unnamed protein product [Caenorhabditis angaria]